MNLRVLQTLVISISLKTEISDIIPGICWCHSFSFSVTNLIAPRNTGRYLTHLFELFVQHLVILHLLPSFWMLLSPVFPHLSQLPSSAPSYHHYIRLVSQQLFVSLDAAVPEDLSAVSLSTFRRCAS